MYLSFVMLRALHSKTQTLEHTDYYKKVLDEEKKEIIKAKVLMKNRDVTLPSLAA